MTKLRPTARNWASARSGESWLGCARGRAGWSYLLWRIDRSRDVQEPEGDWQLHVRCGCGDHDQRQPHRCRRRDPERPRCLHGDCSRHGQRQGRQGRRSRPRRLRPDPSARQRDRRREHHRQPPTDALPGRHYRPRQPHLQRGRNPSRNFPIKDDTVDGNLSLQGWSGLWLGVIRVNVGGNAIVSKNRSVDPLTLPGSDSTEVMTNTISGNLICHRNTPAAQVNALDGGPPTPSPDARSESAPTSDVPAVGSRA